MRCRYGWKFTPCVSERISAPDPTPVPRLLPLMPTLRSLAGALRALHRLLHLVAGSAPGIEVGPGRRLRRGSLRHCGACGGPGRRRQRQRRGRNRLGRRGHRCWRGLLDRRWWRAWGRSRRRGGRPRLHRAQLRQRSAVDLRRRRHRVVRHARRIQLHNLPLMQRVCRRDQLRRVPQILRPVEQDPGDREPDKQGNIDGLAEPAPRALIFDRVQQLDELVLFEVTVAVGADDVDRRRDGAARALVRDDRQGRAGLRAVRGRNLSVRSHGSRRRGFRRRGSRGRGILWCFGLHFVDALDRSVGVLSALGR